MVGFTFGGGLDIALTRNIFLRNTNMCTLRRSRISSWTSIPSVAIDIEGYSAAAEYGQPGGLSLPLPFHEYLKAEPSRAAPPYAPY